MASKETKSDIRHYPYLSVVATVIKTRQAGENIQLRHAKTLSGLCSTATDNHNNNRDIYITLFHHSLLTVLYTYYLTIGNSLV